MNKEMSSILSRFQGAQKGDYTISVATFSDEKNAQRFVSSSFNKDIEILSFTIEQDGILYTKVIYGIFESKEKARQSLVKLGKSLSLEHGMSVKSIGKYKKYFL